MDGWMDGAAQHDLHLHLHLFFSFFFFSFCFLRGFLWVRVSQLVSKLLRLRFAVGLNTATGTVLRK